MVADLHDALLHEYQGQRDCYSEFAATVESLLNKILKQQGIPIHSVTCRGKHVDSLSSKIKRVGRNYKCLADVTGLAGVRVITYFGDYVDRVAEVIESEFEVDRKNSMDKRSLLDPDRFGYLSLHYVIGLSGGRSHLSEYRRFAGLKAEIQIRSLLQHAWAETEHDLGYKTNQSVPRLIRRRFARLAGRLEIADDEFVALREELSKYEREVSERIEKAPASVQLDKASLIAYYRSSATVHELDKAIAALFSAAVVEAPEMSMDRDLDDLSFLGISTVGELENHLRTNDEAIRNFAEAWIGDNRDATLYQGICIFYLAYVLLARQRDAKRILEWSEKLNIGSFFERRDLAGKIIGLAEKFHL